MIAEIISVGTELLMGQTVNTNAQFLAQHLNELGINHYVQTVIGDNPKRLIAVTEQAEQRADIIIYTGGLGPTQDDLTKQVIAEYLDEELIYNTGTGLTANKRKFTGQNIEVTDSKLKMGLVFSDGETFPNTVGKALGTAIKKDSCLYITLPGPPQELKAMFNDYVRPFLIAQLDEQMYLESSYLQFFGIGESDLTMKLDDIFKKQTNPTIASYISPSGITLRLTARSSSAQEACQLLAVMRAEIYQRMGEYIYGEGENYSLSQALADYLRAEKLTISFAESLTGGKAADALVSIKDTSEVFRGSIVAYDADAKATLLGVRQETLKNQGMVSAACAKEMAEGARKIFDTDIAISFTGVAGPAEMEGKPVGTVFMAVAHRGQPTEVTEHCLPGQRQNIRQQVVDMAFRALTKMS